MVLESATVECRLVALFEGCDRVNAWAVVRVVTRRGRQVDFMIALYFLFRWVWWFNGIRLCIYTLVYQGSSTIVHSYEVQKRRWMANAFTYHYDAIFLVP